ncbi:hypothetical protein GE061_013279 [Apolygus lucorum]|uniref:Uncharacterized protein n=1 Tax=Apolygus lucorum TaxID=248454 RepID=A0A8S9XMI9_APOLU|nr:hypothetical protein GE061_013279 [Apolygus lucorum]
MHCGQLVLELLMLGGLVIQSIYALIEDPDILEDGSPSPYDYKSGGGVFKEAYYGYMENEELETHNITIPQVDEPKKNLKTVENARNKSSQVVTENSTDSVSFEEYYQDGYDDDYYKYDEDENSLYAEEDEYSEYDLNEQSKTGNVSAQRNKTRNTVIQNHIQNILKQYETPLNGLDSNIKKPLPWMLDLISKIHAAIIKRKNDYLREKRNLVQMLLLSSITFSALPSTSAAGTEEQETHNCSGKSLSGLLIETIQMMRKTPDKTEKLANILRKVLYHHLHSFGPWTEQNGADLFALFTLMRNSTTSFDAVANIMESKWNIHFESAAAMINKGCRPGVSGVRVYDQIAWAWPKLTVKNDEAIDEEELFKGYFPEDPPAVAAQIQKRLKQLEEIPKVPMNGRCVSASTDEIGSAHQRISDAEKMENESGIEIDNIKGIFRSRNVF